MMGSSISTGAYFVQFGHVAPSLEAWRRLGALAMTRHDGDYPTRRLMELTCKACVRRARYRPPNLRQLLPARRPRPVRIGRVLVYSAARNRPCPPRVGVDGHSVGSAVRPRPVWAASGMTRRPADPREGLAPRRFRLAVPSRRSAPNTFTVLFRRKLRRKKWCQFTKAPSTRFHAHTAT